MAILRKLISAHKRYAKEALAWTAIVMGIGVIRQPESLRVALMCAPLVFSFNALFFAALIPVLEANDKKRRAFGMGENPVDEKTPKA